MAFRLPEYRPPDFHSMPLASAPVAKTCPAPEDGIAPENFHATSNFPEYVQVEEGRWVLVRESRMDCNIVVRRDGRLVVVEPRRLRKNDAVVIGRTENGEDGVHVHTTGFPGSSDGDGGKFAFRTRRTRETPFSRGYDEMYDLLRYERANRGYVTWVIGPAVTFDKDSRVAMQGLIEKGYCQALLSGNALVPIQA